MMRGVRAPRPELLSFRLVDQVWVLEPDQIFVGGNDDDLQVVDLFKFGSLGLGGSRHAGQLLVHPEIVL